MTTASSDGAGEGTLVESPKGGVPSDVETDTTETIEGKELPELQVFMFIVLVECIDVDS